MKRGIVMLMLLLTISLPFVSAGIFDIFKRDVQSAPSGTQDVSVQVGNVAPTVAITSVDSDDVVDLIPATTTSVEIIFDVTDVNGVADIDEGTLVITYTATGEATRSTTGVADCDPRVDNGNTRTFTCRVDMEFYDGAGSWNAQVDIDDIGGLAGSDPTHPFTVNQLKDISLAPATISFGTIGTASTNVVSLQDTTVTNNGNFDVPSSTGLKLTSGLLVGLTTPLEMINGNEFRAASSADSAEVCSGPGGANLVQGSPIDIPNTNLLKGPSSSDTVRHCLVSVSGSLPLSDQVYSTTGTGGVPWTFEI